MMSALYHVHTVYINTLVSLTDLALVFCLSHNACPPTRVWEFVGSILNAFVYLVVCLHQVTEQYCITYRGVVTARYVKTARSLVLYYRSLEVIFYIKDKINTSILQLCTLYRPPDDIRCQVDF